MATNLVIDNGFPRIGTPADAAPLGALSNVVFDSAASGGTFTPAELMADSYVRTGATAAFVETFPTGAVMDAAYPAFPIGGIHRVRLHNRCGYTWSFVSVAGFNKTPNSAQQLNQQTEAWALITRFAVGVWTYEIISSAMGNSLVPTRVASAAAVTYTAAQLGTSNYVIRTGMAASFSDTLPTGTSLDTYFGAGVALGDIEEFILFNNHPAATVMTILAGANCTIIAGSPVTIAGQTSAHCQLTRIAANSWTFEIIGV